MLLLGLTGSIATGKSTVSSILSQAPYSLPVIDADILARQVVEPGTAGYAAIVSHFGPTTPDLLQTPAECGSESGSTGKGRPLNRPALGKRVFGDTEERKRDRMVLNGIVHPAVRKEMARMVGKAYLKGHWAVVLDIPLLFESKLDRFCAAVMVVAVRDPEVQMKRLRERDAHLSEEDAKNRVLSQGDVRVKAKRALARGEGRGVVVWNDDGKEELRKELERVMLKLKHGSPTWWAWTLLLCPPLAVCSGIWTFYQNWRISKAWAAEELQTKAKL